MSLTIVSSPLAALAPTVAGLSSTTDGTASGMDFSALLFNQLGTLSSLAGKELEEEGQEAEASQKEQGSAGDALALFLGNLQQTPVQTPASAPAEESAESGDSLLATSAQEGDEHESLGMHDAALAGQNGKAEKSAARSLNDALNGKPAGSGHTATNDTAATVLSAPAGGENSGDLVGSTSAATSFADLLAARSESGGEAIAAPAQPLAAQPHKPQASATSHNATPVQTPLGNPGWNQEFGEKLVWMTKNEQQSAQISINPPQLGPIQIHINLNGDQATASFASPFGEVRQAIESALPQLKEMLASAGIDLGQANVGANLAQQQREAPQQQAKARRDGDENAILPATSDHAVGANLAPSPVARGRGMVDLFA